MLSDEELKSIQCDKNKITSIVLPKDSKLEDLKCDENPITFLDLTGQKELKSLSCPNMPIKTLDLTNQTKLDYLNVSDCRLTSLILPDCEMQGQYCAGLGAFLKQNYVDFKELTIFPDFDMERVQTMQLKKNGEEPVDVSMEALEQDDFRIENLDLGDEIAYKYNCAVDPSKDTKNVEFTVHVGAAESEYPPAYGDGMYPPENKRYLAAYLMKTLGDIKLTEGWQWKEGTDTEKEMRIGRLTTAAAIYTGADGYYYSSNRLSVEIAMWRMACQYPSESFIHHEAKAPTLTERGNVEYYECGDCGTCYTQPDDFSHALSTEEIELPILYLADQMESTVSRFAYGEEIKNLDIFRMKWNENSGEESVRVTSLDIKKVNYQKNENSDEEVISGNGGFYIEKDGDNEAYVDISREDPEKSLGGLSCDGLLKPGKYDLELTLHVKPLSGESDQETAQAVEQEIPLRRTIIVENIKETPGMPEAAMEVPYTTRVVGEVLLEGDWKWTSGDSEKALAVGEAVTVTAEYTGADGDLYENILQKVTILRLACDHPADKMELRNKVKNSCVEGYTGDEFCTQCGEVLEPGETLPARHDLTLIGAKEATDTEPGNIAYYVCGSCGKYFKDADGTEETTLEKVTIPAWGTPVPSLTPVPTSKVTEMPDPTKTAAASDPTKEPSKTEMPATADPTKEPSKTEIPSTAEPTKEPVKTETPAASTDVPTQQPSTTEPVTTPVSPELPTPGQSMAPEPSQAPAPLAVETPKETEEPETTEEPDETPEVTLASNVKKPARKGKLITDSQGNRYKVTSSNLKKPTVQFYSPGAKVKKVVISERVRINGIYYYVTSLRSRAFDGVCSGLKVSVPRSKLEEYKKMLQNKGLKKTIPVFYGKSNNMSVLSVI